MSQRIFENCLTKELQRGVIAGAQVCICKGEERILTENYGYADVERGELMCANTILRMYSMTKPVTAVAVSILLERGILRLQDPVSMFFPEYANMEVYCESGNVEANCPLYISDLLHMTAGVVYPGDSGAERVMAQGFQSIEKKIQSDNSMTTQEVASSIASFPLAFQPGSAWHYGFSADILGGIVSKVTGKTYGSFLQEEIFGPLEMWDTGFYVSPQKQKRLAQLYAYRNEVREIDVSRHLGLTFGLQPPMFESGGAGLFSTLQDYTVFAMMLANGGVYKGRRVLCKESVSNFMQSALTREQEKTIYFDHIKGYGYGNLMRVSAGTKVGGEQKGEFGWDGWSGGYFSVDPCSKTTFFFGTQGSGYSNPPLIDEIKRLYYEFMSLR